MADKKPILCEITAFYQGGTKLRASLALSRDKVVAEINAAKKEVRDAVLETVEESGDESFLYLTRTNLLFYNIRVEKPVSLIEVAQAGSVPPAIVK